MDGGRGGKRKRQRNGNQACDPHSMFYFTGYLEETESKLSVAQRMWERQQ